LSVVIPALWRLVLFEKSLNACKPLFDDMLVVDCHPELWVEGVAVRFAALLQFALLVLLQIAHWLLNRKWARSLGLVKSAVQVWRRHTS
jgi:hypothetical protein